MDIFTELELISVAPSVMRAFTEEPSPETEVCLDFLAEGLLQELKATRSTNVKRDLIKAFTTQAICSGLLIATRRHNIDMIMLTENTDTEH